MKKHEWLCDNCGNSIPFRQPELPEDEYRSEMNETKKCPKCGDTMYFDEVEQAKRLVPPPSGAKDK